MAESTFTFRVEEDLKSAFADAAKAQDRTSAQLLRVLMRQAVEGAREKTEYEAWFLEQVDIGLKEADDPNAVWVPHEEVVEDMKRQRAEILAMIKDAAE